METLLLNDLSEQESALINRAKDVSALYYNPKGFRYASSALLCDDGNIYAGASIRRMGAGSSTCAERMAVDQAIFNGSFVPKMMAVVGYSKGDSLDQIISPCGPCRQTMMEMILGAEKPDCDPIFLLTNQGQEKVIRITFSELFPLAYEGAIKLL